MRGFRARAFALTFLWTLGARAQTAVSHSETRIRIDDCPEELAGPLPSLVKLEIDVLLRERGPTRAPPESIAIRCTEDRAQIEVTMDGSSRESTLDLGALTAEHRARAIALAAAELVHSLSSRAPTMVAPTKPSAAPAKPLIAPTERSTPEPSPRGWSQRPTLFVGGLAEWLGKPATSLLGARLAFHYPLGSLLVPALSMDGSLGGFPSRSARIAVETLSGAAHLYVGVATGSVRWDAGPGARLGWVHLAGHPDTGSTLEGRSLAAAWGGPEARARVAYRATTLRSPLFALELGAGLVVLPVRGLVDGSEQLYALKGPWLSLCAELGLGL